MARAKQAARHAGGSGQRNSGPSRRVRIGSVPPSAPGFGGRADLAAAVAAALLPGTSVVLVPGSSFAEGPGNWLGASGKTQLAASVAEGLWQSGAVDVLVWVGGADRASVLAAYARACLEAAGTDISAGDEAAAVFVSWLASSARSWLVVLDDVADPDVLDGLWPAGPAGRVLITTSRFPVMSAQAARVLPVGVYSVREALDCVTERLIAAPAQRQGAMELIETAGREPMALGQACAVMESSGMSCQDYRDYMMRRRQQLRFAPGEVPSSAAATWTLSLDHAETLLPGSVVRLLLVLLAVLDGNGIPGTLLGSAAVAAYIGPAASTGSGRWSTWNALRVLERAGLISVDQAEQPPLVRISRAVQAAIRAVAPARLLNRAAVVAADALLETWPGTEPHGWTATSARANATVLLTVAGQALQGDGLHPLLLRAGISLDEARS